ncbi:hypothetical protein BH10PLA2_BH10PLA2_31040 [soil metagenome]
MDRYAATYTDANGSETTTISNDGANLALSLRGVEFVGCDFDSLEPTGASPEQLQSFTLNQGSLCSCRIQCRIPVPVQECGKLFEGWLSIELVLGNPGPKGGLDREELGIVLEYNGQQWAGSGKSGWFEDELLDIQGQLPEGTFFNACINCLYSDYSPADHGLFGGMLCYRNLKAEYLSIKSKREFLVLLHRREDRSVQETYLCHEFERRVPGTGYRG